MTRVTTLLLLAVIVIGCNKAQPIANVTVEEPTLPAAVPNPSEPKAAGAAETKYLCFQVSTGLYDQYGSQFASPPPGHFSLSKAQLEEFVHSLTKAIGATGDARHKLAFSIGPLCLDMPDGETSQFIRDSFAVARDNDVAVALHLDDSMGWGQRKDLISNPDNIESVDWKLIPNKGRRIDWGRTPMKITPQLCFNSPEVQAAVKSRGTLIGAVVKKELDVLKTAGKEHLFAGFIAGWETRIGRDYDSNRPLGYRALSHRGFSEKNPPKDADRERAQVVKEFMELWAHSLRAGGIPREKIFCHIAFTPQGLDPQEGQGGQPGAAVATTSTFSPPEVAFSAAYRPGFSTYPDGATFKEIYAVLAQHGSPAWLSGEGMNVSPSGMPGEPNMETYLGRHFNHGAVLLNIMPWGMGGEALRNKFFRVATENPECLAAYAKFLRGEVLIETAPTGLSFQDKMDRIGKELPGWVQKTGKQAEVMPKIEKIKALAKDGKFQEADKVADEILTLISSPKKP